MDTFTQRYINAIKMATTDEELEDIVDAIYADGFEDGYDEGEADCIG